MRVWETSGETVYLEKRRQRWYALHDLPADVRAAFGGKARLVQSLETGEHKEAKRRAAVLEVRWLSEIEEARTGSKDHLASDARYWHTQLQRAAPEHREMVSSLIADKARDMALSAAARHGITDEKDPRYHDLPEVAEAERFAQIAQGTLVAFNEHLDDYIKLASGKISQKTLDMGKSVATKFALEFPYVTDVSRKAVQQWLNKQTDKKPATLTRDLTFLRQYWRYLASLELVPEDAEPFSKLTLHKSSKAAVQDARRPFKPADVVKLHSIAQANGDTDLADLITLGMWTGARLEELCALKLDKVHPEYFEIDDAKTPDGWREVPIHSHLKDTVERLKKASTDGFLLSGLTVNKYGDRSNAVGKRFGRMKTAQGFNRTYVYHSIRKTVITLLENTGCPESVAAGIVGHDHPTMTFGLYSGGAALKVKAEALEKLSYNGPL